MKHFDARAANRVVEPEHHVAGARASGITLGREDDDERRVAALPHRRDELPARSLVEVRVEIAVDAAHERLALGVAEPHVVLEHHRSVRREHQAAEQHPTERCAASCHLAERRQHGAFHGVGDERLGGDRHRRVCAHPARVRAGITVTDALVVLGAAEHQRIGACAQCEQRQLRTVESLLDHARAPGVAERGARQVVVHRVGRFVAAAGHEHALARGEPVGLHHVPSVERVEKRRGVALLTGGEHCMPRSGHTGLHEHVFHERLAALEPGRRGRRAEAGTTACAHRVGDPRDQWIFRPDHHESRVELVGEIGDGLRRARVDGDALADRLHAGVAGRAHHLVDRRRLRQLPGERVLAPSRSDDEDPRGHRSGLPETHAARGSTTVWSRSGPTDTKLTCTPVNCSMNRT